ncbi:MAG: alpha/beta fold hydrolase [Bryobacterales bacterium]|nr:alpha/beta fold hydrolase [Bryobacterales bacterium]
MSNTAVFLIVAIVAALLMSGAVWLAERNIRVRGKRRTPADDATARAATGGAAVVERAEVRAVDGVPLRAWLLHDPRTSNGRAALVLHGFVDTRAAMLPHAAMLLRQGFAVLLPDSRGHGESGGREVTFGLRESEDLRTWGDWLCARLGVERFVGLGQSMGACVLLHALPAEGRLEAVIAESAFTTFHAAAYDKLADRYGLPRRAAHIAFRPVGELAFAYVRWRYGIDLSRARPVDAIQRAAPPVLLIHGADDRAIRVTHSRELHAASGGCGYWEVPGAGHTEPIRVAAQEYERRVAAWLAAVISPTAGNRA